MSYRKGLLVPWGYGSTRHTLGWIEERLLANYHPEFVARFVHWLDHENGRLGPGSTFRVTQPGGPGYAPEGKSFHQYQTFSDGVTGAAAVDLVKYAGSGRTHINVSWFDVPYRGTAASVEWGLHANVGMPGDPYPKGEPWHIQPIEVFGWGEWNSAGRSSPKKDYLMAGSKPGAKPTPPSDPVKTYVVRSGDGWFKIAQALGMPTTQESYDRLRHQLLASAGRDVPWPGDTLTCCTENAPKPPPPPAGHPDPDTLPLPPHTPMIRRGQTGPNVTWLQVMLRVAADGIFGMATESALWTHQRNLGVTADGVYGPQTALAWESWRKGLGLPKIA